LIKLRISQSKHVKAISLQFCELTQLIFSEALLAGNCGRIVMLNLLERAKVEFSF
jgi:hypothetical protein